MTARTLSAIFATAVVFVAGTCPIDAVAEPCGKNHYILEFPVGCEWVSAGTLGAERYLHTATLLEDGRVLVAGGTYGSAHNVELFDPKTRTWGLAAPMGRNRSGHTATRLLDGRVLVAGGDPTRYDARHGFAIEYGGTAEIFDPAKGSWTPTGAMNTPRGGFGVTATLLLDGRVLVVGGWGIGVDGESKVLRSAELYDPESGQWTATGELGVGRYSHTATALGDGKVLVVGGVDDDFFVTSTSSAEIYDPATGSWSPTGALEVGRAEHSSVLLPDGRVLVSGGFVSVNPPGGGYMEFSTARTLEAYDPHSGAWTPAGNLAVARFGHTATLLPDGATLIAGGNRSTGEVPGVQYEMQASSEAWRDGIDPAVPMKRLAEARMRHTATRLLDGSVLVVGGWGKGDGRRLRSAELYLAPPSN